MKSGFYQRTTKNGFQQSPVSLPVAACRAKKSAFIPSSNSGQDRGERFMKDGISRCLNKVNQFERSFKYVCF
jgi:hypothetical protein